MTINHQRRSRLMQLGIKQQSWELEELKKRNRDAKDALTKAKDSLRRIEASIKEAEQTIRQAFQGQLNLELEAISAARQYLTEQQGLRIRQAMEQQRAAQTVDLAETRLKQTALYIKALEQIKAVSDKEIDRIEENRMAEHHAELWYQRYEGNLWQK
jgi:cysteinyl-tRNA synthetase